MLRVLRLIFVHNSAQNYARLITLIVTDLWSAMFECGMSHYIETIMFALFVNLWRHIVKKLIIFHRDKCSCMSQSHYVFQITCLNLSEHLNIPPFRN